MYVGSGEQFLCQSNVSNIQQTATSQNVNGFAKQHGAADSMQSSKHTQVQEDANQETCS